MVVCDDALCCVAVVFVEGFPSAGPVPAPAAAVAVGFHLVVAEEQVFGSDLAAAVALAFVLAPAAEVSLAAEVCLAAAEAWRLLHSFVAGFHPDLAVDVAGARFWSCCDAEKNVVFSSCHFYQGFAS